MSLFKDVKKAMVYLVNKNTWETRKHS